MKLRNFFAATLAAALSLFFLTNGGESFDSYKSFIVKNGNFFRVMFMDRNDEPEATFRIRKDRNDVVIDIELINVSQFEVESIILLPVS